MARTAVSGSLIGSRPTRLTIDVTPVLRGRIKLTAFERGITVAEMLRTLLEREYMPGDGGLL